MPALLGLPRTAYTSKISIASLNTQVNWASLASRLLVGGPLLSFPDLPGHRAVLGASAEAVW